MNTLELHLSDSAGRLEPLIDRDPRAGRQEVAGTFFLWDVLERFDQGRGEVDPRGLRALKPSCVRFATLRQARTHGFLEVLIFYVKLELCTSLN